jgi:hypothetical protein
MIKAIYEITQLTHSMSESFSSNTGSKTKMSTLATCIQHIENSSKNYERQKKKEIKRQVNWK